MADRTETVSLWRCRRCGRWSHAKRDPIAHKPERPDHENAEPWEWRAEWCGPFDRWEAKLVESSQRELPHVGQPVVLSWRKYVAQPREPADAPF